MPVLSSILKTRTRAHSNGLMSGDRCRALGGTSRGGGALRVHMRREWISAVGFVECDGGFLMEGRSEVS